MAVRIRKVRAIAPCGRHVALALCVAVLASSLSSAQPFVRGFSEGHRSSVEAKLSTCCGWAGVHGGRVPGGEHHPRASTALLVSAGARDLRAC